MRLISSLGAPLIVKINRLINYLIRCLDYLVIRKLLPLKGTSSSLSIRFYYDMIFLMLTYYIIRLFNWVLKLYRVVYFQL